MDEGIYQIAEQIVQIHQEAYAAHLPSVEDVCSRTVSENELSHLLDYLLDFACDEKMLGLYKRVCLCYRKGGRLRQNVESPFGEIRHDGMKRTIEYYNENVQSYYELIAHADMSPLCDRFLRYVTPGEKIIDIGSRSGRDIKYFLSKGYEAE